MFAQKQAVFIMTQQELLEISLESKNISVENMVKRSGNVRNVQSVMQFNQTGKLTPKPVVPKSIDVTVELYFQGN